MLFTDVQRSVRLNKKKKSTNISPYPDDVIDRLARAFYPAILTCWNSEEGQRSLVGARPRHLANARPFGRLKAPLGLSLLRKRELAYGRQSRLIMPPAKKNRAFPTGNALLYISLSSVVLIASFTNSAILNDRFAICNSRLLSTNQIVNCNGRVRPGGAPCFLFCLTFPCSAVLFSLPTGCKRRRSPQTSRTQTMPCRCPWCG